MTFKHKLSCRQALLKDRRVLYVAATLAAAVVASCELPARTTDTGTTLAQVVVLPKTVNLVQNQSTDFVAFGVSTASDTMPVAVNWSVTGGNITDSVTSKGMHYGHFKAGAQTGQYKVRAQDPATGMSDSATAVATAAATGSTTIAATSEGHSGTATLTVTAVTVPVASVTVSPASASVPVGQTVQLAATPKDANGNALSGRTVTWASSNSSVGTVNGSGLVTGVVAGATTITATSEGQSGTSVVTVAPVPVASVTVSPAPASVQAGQTVQLTATPKDANGNTLTGRTVTWASSNTSVGTVNASGLVTGVVAGSTTITATSEGKSGTSAVTVTAAPVPVASGTVNPATAAVFVGQTTQLTATPKDANGNTLTGRTITRATSPSSIAGVNGSGLAAGVAVGSATITATSEGKSGTSTIPVT